MTPGVEPLRIALLGGFDVHSSSGEPISLPSRNARGLLAYLAMSAGRAQARDKLATLLWGGSSADKARASLRQTLSQLRRALNVSEREVLRGDGNAIVLEASAVTVDAVRFQELVGVGTPEALEEASALYHGSFLEGIGPLADAFETWLMAERMRLHELAEAGLTRLLEHYQRVQATDDAIRVAHRLLNLDALQESVHRLLMRLYVEQGRPRSALKQYERCCELFQRELGVAPEPETRQLAEQIRSELPRAATTEAYRLHQSYAGDSAPQPVAGSVVQHLPGVDSQADRRAAPAAEAERRHVTLMACGLVDVAQLAMRLDPEEFRTLITGFENCCERLVSRHSGHVYQFAGDSVTACFGYPRADEHSAEQAVRAGLEIVAAVGNLALLSDVRMQARISIASGEVVVGKRVYEDGLSEETITGGVLHVAVGLQAASEPDSVVVAESTRQLLGDLFEYRGLCGQTLEGFDTPMRGWQILGERGGKSRFEATRGIAALSPLIGRDEEIELLVRRWNAAKSGSGQVVVLVGEPGIGKSRLIEELRETLAGETHLRLSYYCSPHHQESALYPVIQQLERAAGYAREDPPAIKLERLEALLGEATADFPEAVPLIADLLSIPTGERYPPLNLTPQRRKTKTVEVLDAQLCRLTKRQPALILFEDVHWSDSSTREFLERLVDLVPTLPALLLITQRPGSSLPRLGEPHVTSLIVKRLRRSESESLVAKLTGERNLPSEVLAQIVDRADGVPLFIEELTKNALEDHGLGGSGDRYAPGRLPPAAIGVPSTLYDLLVTRLDRLGSAKAVAQEAAVIGRRYSYELLAAVTSSSEADLRAALARLIDAELVYAHGTPPDASYSFKHALVQDAIYASLLRADRGPLHERIAKVLEERFPETREMEPEVLAHHFAGAGLNAQAILYWQKAGELAMRRWAQREAIAYCDKALALLGTLPATPERSGQELGLQVLLGQAWTLSAGYAVPEVEAALTRARDLCEEIGDRNHLFFVLLGLWQLHIARQEIEPASDTAERLLSLALSQKNRDFVIEAHVAQIVTSYTVGAFEKMLTLANEATALIDAEQNDGHMQTFGYDSRVVISIGASWALWTVGYPAQASSKMQDALATARKLAHPYTQSMAFLYSAWLHVFRREASVACGDAEHAIAISIEHGFAWPQAYAMSLHGWALAETGRTAEGINEIRDAIATLGRMGHDLWRPHHEGLLAAACARAGQTEEALAVVTQALDNAQRTGDLEHAAELNRQKGELTLQRGNPQDASEAQRYFGRAMEIARQQKAKSWELRAAISLAGLWLEQGKRQQARELLTPIRDWFTEGFDTQDLQDARALLDKLA